MQPQSFQLSNPLLFSKASSCWTLRKEENRKGKERLARRHFTSPCEQWEEHSRAVCETWYYKLSLLVKRPVVKRSSLPNKYTNIIYFNMAIGSQRVLKHNCKVWQNAQHCFHISPGSGLISLTVKCLQSMWYFTTTQKNHGKLKSKHGEPLRCQDGVTGEGSLFLTIS